MAAINLHIENNYSSYAYVINFIVILDHENIDTDKMFMTLPLILTNIQVCLHIHVASVCRPIASVCLPLASVCRLIAQ